MLASPNGGIDRHASARLQFGGMWLPEEPQPVIAQGVVDAAFAVVLDGRAGAGHISSAVLMPRLSALLHDDALRQGVHAVPDAAARVAAAAGLPWTIGRSPAIDVAYEDVEAAASREMQGDRLLRATQRLIDALHADQAGTIILVLPTPPAGDPGAASEGRAGELTLIAPSAVAEPQIGRPEPLPSGGRFDSTFAASEFTGLPERKVAALAARFALDASPDEPGPHRPRRNERDLVAPGITVAAGAQAAHLFAFASVGRADPMHDGAVAPSSAAHDGTGAPGHGAIAAVGVEPAEIAVDAPRAAGAADAHRSDGGEAASVAAVGGAPDLGAAADAMVIVAPPPGAPPGTVSIVLAAEGRSAPPVAASGGGEAGAKSHTPPAPALTTEPVPGAPAQCQAATPTSADASSSFPPGGHAPDPAPSPAPSPATSGGGSAADNPPSAQAAAGRTGIDATGQSANAPPASAPADEPHGQGNDKSLGQAASDAAGIDGTHGNGEGHGAAPAAGDIVAATSDATGVDDTHANGKGVGQAAADTVVAVSAATGVDDTHDKGHGASQAATDTVAAASDATGVDDTHGNGNGHGADQAAADTAAAASDATGVDDTHGNAKGQGASQAATDTVAAASDATGVDDARGNAKGQGASQAATVTVAAASDATGADDAHGNGNGQAHGADQAATDTVAAASGAAVADDAHGNGNGQDRGADQAATDTVVAASDATLAVDTPSGHGGNQIAADSVAVASDPAGAADTHGSGQGMGAGQSAQPVTAASIDDTQSNDKGQGHAADPIVIVLAEPIVIADPHAQGSDESLGSTVAPNGAPVLGLSDLVAPLGVEIDPSPGLWAGATTAPAEQVAPTDADPSPHGNAGGHDLHAAIIASLLPPLSGHHAHA